MATFSPVMVSNAELKDKLKTLKHLLSWRVCAYIVLTGIKAECIMKGYEE